MEIGKPLAVLNNSSKNGANEKKAHQISDSVYEFFRDFHSKCFLNRALLYGYDSVKTLFQSKSKIICPVAYRVCQELKCFLLNNLKQPQLIAFNSLEQSQKYLDSLNEILSNIYVSKGINNLLAEAFEDFLCYGIGIVKINTSGIEHALLQPTRISPLNVVFDYSSSIPQFFIEEEFLSTSETLERFNLEKNIIDTLGKPTEPKILYSGSHWDVLVKNFFMKGDGTIISTNTVQDIFSDKFSKKMVKQTPALGMNTVRSEFRLAFLKDKKDGTVKHIYEKNVFINDLLCETQTLAAGNLPYMLIKHNNIKTLPVNEYFYSFIDSVRADIILYNVLYNLQIDSTINASQAAGLIILDNEAIQNSQNQKTALNNIINVKTGVDQSINDVLTITPPIGMSQDIQNELQLCRNRIREASGLANFEKPMESGFHEKLRLDRENHNMSVTLTPVDDFIVNTGVFLKNIIKRIIDINSTILEKFVAFPEELTQEYLTTMKNVMENTCLSVKESEESYSYKKKILNDLLTIKELTGMPITANASEIAQMLNMPEQVVNILNNYNASDDTATTLETQQATMDIAKTESEIDKNAAMAQKYRAESKEKPKEKSK